MASASIMSTSKAGVSVCIAMLLVSSIFLLMTGSINLSPATYGATGLAPKHRLTGAIHFLGPSRKVSVVLFLLCAPILGFALGWKELKPRMTDMSESIERRERIYEVARQMVNDFGIFGSGPGTYESVSELYRPPTAGFWPTQVHNDWLETRITFGLPGVVLILLSLVTVLLHRTGSGGAFVEIEFVFLSWLALAGCLVHARFDFPFQVHSILFLFLLICAILFTVSRRG
jgi:O-antigen ligase